MKVAIIGTRKVSDVKLKELSQGMNAFFKQFNLEVDYVYSGNAEGVDQIANEFGEKCVVWLPWRGHNKEFLTNQKIEVVGDDCRYDALLDSMFDNFSQASPGVKKLIRRNAFIILGDDKYPPADIVLWHTGRGVKGGTAYGIKIAKRHGIRTVEFK